jgi:hypothetical protein
MPETRRGRIELLVVVGLTLVFWLVVLVWFGTIVWAQAGPIARRGQSVAWDYVDAALTDAGAPVDYFHVCYDVTAPCVDVTPAASRFVDTPPPPTGTSTYKSVIPLTLPLGNHTVLVSACNAGGCGPASSPFAFALVASAPTLTPTNLRIR